MSNGDKATIAIAAAVTFWALTTQNEAVESIVYPLKKKLGLAPQ